jgi:hypothetical protein
MSVLTITLLASLLICGLWMGANGTDAEGIGFHRTLGIASVMFGLATSVLAIKAAGKKPKKAN